MHAFTLLKRSSADIYPPLHLPPPQGSKGPQGGSKESTKGPKRDPENTQRAPRGAKGIQKSTTNHKIWYHK